VIDRRQRAPQADDKDPLACCPSGRQPAGLNEETTSIMRVDGARRHRPRSRTLDPRHALVRIDLDHVRMAQVLSAIRQTGATRNQ